MVGYRERKSGAQSLDDAQPGLCMFLRLEQKSREGSTKRLFDSNDTVQTIG